MPESEDIVMAKTVQTAPIRILAEGLKSMLVEMSLVFDKDGIRMIAMDNTRTVLTHMRLHASKFEQYEYNHSAPRLDVGLNTDHFYRIVKTVTNDDTITFSVSKSESNHLCITLENGEKKRRIRNKLNLLDRDESDINMPETEFATRITMPSMDFQKICRDMTLLSAKTVDIKNVGGTLTFTCKGPFASQTVTMGDSTSDMAITKTKPDEIVSGTFSLPHLVLFTKCSNLSNNLEIHMKNDWFLMIRYVIANLGDIKLCLMPCSS
jgi:proliferating cell nuclear antigen